MNATRQTVGSTLQNLEALLDRIRDGISDVRLFATHRSEQEGGFDQMTSGPSCNLPLLSALVYDGRRWIVYDGNFLNAARDSRAGEVSCLIDAAVKQGTVRYGTNPVNFTAGMTAEEAAKYLKNITTAPLTEETRSQYGGMLSTHLVL
ncbi:hypothetical protein [Rhodobacter sp. NSM]|uniref:hypothetical protein n=1 Tax=Rhodobacter sp. NSM TaxID=3457501 RepID=UPI003FD3C07C